MDKFIREVSKRKETLAYDDVLRNEDYYYEYAKDSTESRKKSLFVKVLPDCNSSTLTPHNKF
jgi:hypothetical protein